MNAPLAFYKQPRLLDRQTDQRMRVRPVTDYRMAQGLNAMLLQAVEFADACKEYVIGFAPSVPPTLQAASGKPVAKASIAPVAILGLRDGENLMVNADGRWDARYLPAFLRRYPFAYAADAQGRMNLLVDAQWQGFSDKDGELLLQPDGEPTPFLQQVMQYLDRFEQETQRTQVFCERLVALDLLVSRQLDGKLPDTAGGKTITVGGFSVVDEARLRALPDATVGELHRSGMLSLIHAHVVSLGNAARLLERLTPRAIEAAAGTPPAPTAPQPR